MLYRHFVRWCLMAGKVIDWHMLVMAGIAASLPIFLAASIGRWQDGLIASLGAMVFLNLPYQGSFLFRMVQLLACSFGFVACFSLGFIAKSYL